MADPFATAAIEAELAADGISARLVRFDMPQPTRGVHARTGSYHINLCLTPRPLDARAGYPAHWGPHRLERLGDVFLLPPEKQLFIAGGSGRQISLVCEIAPDLVIAAIGRELEWTDQRLAATLDVPSARLRALLFRLSEEVRHPGLAWPAMLGHMAGVLAIEIGRFCLEVEERPVTGGLAGWRLRLIDERLADAAPSPTLAELADLCNISARQLTRGFRVSRGSSIGDYIEGRRMETAKRQLVAGESVKTVAFALGYGSPSSFACAFRRAVGIAPSQFRQRQARNLR